MIRFKKEANASNWYIAKLMSYYPWFDESNYLLGGFSSFSEHYEHVKSTIYNNEQKQGLFFSRGGK